MQDNRDPLQHQAITPTIMHLSPAHQTSKVLKSCMGKKNNFPAFYTGMWHRSKVIPLSQNHTTFDRKAFFSS